MRTFPKKLVKHKKLGLYILRWQLSTPILAATIYFLPFSTLPKTVIANVVGALLFFPVDKKILNNQDDSS